LFRIEFTKSELRFAIDAAFRKQNITIAFPQMDVWIRNQGNA
jgi:small-conductance mechanosensitive channel